MNTLLLWNDPETNCIIKFSVEYLIEANTLHVLDVKPLEVSLLDLQWNTVVTRMGVRTRGEYDLLRDRFVGSDGLKMLINEIADRHNISLVAG